MVGSQIALSGDRPLAVAGMTAEAAVKVLNRGHSAEYEAALKHTAGGFYPVERPRRPNDPPDYGPGPMVRVMGKFPLPEGEGAALALREARGRRMAAEAALAETHEATVKAWLLELSVGVHGAPRGADLDAAIEGHSAWLLRRWKLPAVCFTEASLLRAVEANPGGFWPSPIEIKEALGSYVRRMELMLKQATKAERALLEFGA